MILKGLYIYGIIPNYYPTEQFRELEKMDVQSISFGKVSAIASERAVIDFRDLGTEALAKLLLSHQQIIESVMALGFNTIIPVRLGTFAKNASQLKKILENGYSLIQQTFEKISGFIEIDVVATWADFSKVIGEIAIDPQVMELKQKIQNSDSITHADQFEIGFLVKQLLDRKRAEMANKIFISLEPICQNVRQHEVLNDQMISNTAFMVNRQQQELIEKGLDELDAELNGILNFKLVGPLPCYSFFTLEANLLQFDDLLQSREILGVGEEVSEKSLKLAYHKKAKLFHPDQNADEDNGEKFREIQQAYLTLLTYVKDNMPDSDQEYFKITADEFVDDCYIIKIKD